MHGEWDIACRFQTPLGTLTLNSTSGEQYLIDKDASRIVHALRVTSDPIPEGMGETFHRRFENGTELRLKINLWKDGQPACGQDLREMVETLSGHIRSILNGDGRFFYQPTGYPDERLLDEIRWLSPFEESHGTGDLVSLSFAIDSPFPYVIDSPQDTIELVDGVSQVITNDGNAPFYPVFHVGASAGFTITNNTTGFSIVYDSTRPGGQPITGSEYAEIDSFRPVIYLNGDEDNLKANIDPLNSDFFPLEPGNNTVIIIGADSDVLVNNAWVPV